MRKVLLALVVLSLVRCTLITCDEICDVPFDGGTAGGGAAGGGAAGGGAAGGGAAGGGAAGGDAGGAAGGSELDAGEADAGLDAGMGGGAGGGAAGGAGGGVAPHTSVVFVTNGTFHGNFGLQAGGVFGAAAADKLCNTAAMNASLPGTFKAWVSGGIGVGPSSRLNDSSPWQLAGTTLVAFSSRPALNGPSAVPINRNESGLPVTGTTAVWTGAANGFTAGSSCNTWGSNFASVGGVQGSTSSTTQWTNAGVDAGCNLTAHLYCFEQQ